MIKTLRGLLLNNDVIREYVDNKNIYLEFKPLKDVKRYIILKEKPLDIGHIERYQIDALIFGPDLEEILKVEKELRKELNDKDGTRVIKSSDVVIRDLTMLMGGGRQYIEDKGSFVSVQYFRVTI